MNSVVLFEILVVWPPIPVKLGSGYWRDQIQWHSRIHEPAVQVVGATQASHVVSVYVYTCMYVCALSILSLYLKQGLAYAANHSVRFEGGIKWGG